MEENSWEIYHIARHSLQQLMNEIFVEIAMQISSTKTKGRVIAVFEYIQYKDNEN